MVLYNHGVCQLAGDRFVVGIYLVIKRDCQALCPWPKDNVATL